MIKAILTFIKNIEFQHHIVGYGDYFRFNINYRKSKHVNRIIFSFIASKKKLELSFLDLYLVIGKCTNLKAAKLTEEELRLLDEELLDE